MTPNDLDRIFANGSHEDIFSAITHFVPLKQGEDAILGQKALSFLAATLRALKWLCVRRSMPLTADMAREHLSLEHAMLLAGLPVGAPVVGATLPEDVIKPLRLYLTSAVDGFDRTKPFHEQDEEAMKFHSVIQGICKEFLTTAADATPGEM